MSTTLDVRAFTPHGFFARFTPPEQAAIILSENDQVRVFRFLFGISDRILSTDPRLEQGRQLLLTVGLITPARSAEIFDFGA